jgi:hypothetical protein
MPINFRSRGLLLPVTDGIPVTLEIDGASAPRSLDGGTGETDGTVTDGIPVTLEIDGASAPRSLDGGTGETDGIVVD